ncbi:MAG: hypothetical protein KDD73_08930 [Anaerolineales bacterium]|nr:hypothetical protein [Anaerolineales bacterium]MCB9128267.1 hypothetical protein [Ardenticatenales bacterium]
MKRVGLLVGKEHSFPEALIAEITLREMPVEAQMVKLGGLPMNASVHYDVLVDRISHEVPFYQSYLKNAVLQGVTVINNPFWRIVDDKFFGTALGAKLGVAMPKTILLPNKDYIEGVVEESLRNLQYPIDWEAFLDYTGLPVVLKAHWGGGWKDVHIIHSKTELWERYNQIGTKTMILQEYIEWDQYVRCLVIGQEDVLPVLWDPRKPHFERYEESQPPLDPALKATIIDHAQRLCRGLGYDMNTVEFAVRDGVPIAIDFMNSAPDFDVSSLGDHYFSWVVEKMATLCIRLAVESHPAAPTTWPAFFDPQ